MTWYGPAVEAICNYVPQRLSSKQVDSHTYGGERLFEFRVLNGDLQIPRPHENDDNVHTKGDGAWGTWVER